MANWEYKFLVARLFFDDRGGKGTSVTVNGVDSADTHVDALAAQLGAEGWEFLTMGATADATYYAFRKEQVAPSQQPFSAMATPTNPAFTKTNPHV